MSAPLAWVKATGAADGTRGELAEILGSDARLEHLRYKPGYSLLARVVPAGDGPPSWFALFAPEARDKVSKLRRSATKSGIPLIDVPMPGHPDVTLLSGPVGADLRLRRRLRAVRGLVDRTGAPTGEVLAYNPWKRIVQIVDSPRVDGGIAAEGEVIAKVSAASAPDDGDAMARVLAELAAQGVQVLEPVSTPMPGTQLLPYVRGGDLARMLVGTSDAGDRGGSQGDLLAETGEALARLHGADRARVERSLGDAGPLRTVDPVARLVGARNAVTAVVPHLRDAFDRVASAVEDVWEDTAPVLLHGDFSSDQVLVGERILLNDLDRVCAGAPGFDLGSYAAVELLADRADTIDPFIAAYGEARGSTPEGVYGWTALHVLLRSVEPVRDVAPEHADEAARRIELAQHLVDGARSPVVANRSGEAGPTAASEGAGTAHRQSQRMTDRPLLPHTLVTPAGKLEVGRAWPKADGTQLFEGRDEIGRLRAGTLSAQGDVDVLPFASDDRLPGLSPGALSVGATSTGRELLVHRAGRRAVVRIPVRSEGADGSGSGDAVYVKHLRPTKVAHVVKATKVAGDLARAAGFSAPEVVTADAHSLTVAAVPGVTLLDLAQEPDPSAWRAAWGTWLDGWPRLVRAVPGETASGRLGAGTIDVHDAADEAAVVATWARHLVEFDPLGWDDDRSGRALGRAYLAATEDVAVALRDGARNTPSRGDGGLPAHWGIAHRDLHDGQMLADPATGALSLLDFDTLAYAEPELDLGNLIAHMRLRHRQGVLGLRARNIALAAIDRAADRMQLDENRLRVYTQASALRLVGVYAFRPRWRECARDLCSSLVR